ncbi:Rne/Rng family ribonuclease [Candidatus Bipolaricaulota bacterium]|nr:Rne/Rng family ribonuclease [Candidatus Bipolaricaulota bacterium]
MKQILISSKDGQNGEKRIAILENGKLVEIFYEDFQQDKLVGNIYKGRVEDILSGLGSAFVDVGEEQSLFLSRSEINQAILRSRGFDPNEYPPMINKVINEGESLIVQVKRGGIGSKNPQGTTKVSLPGRYWVFLPKDSRLGISRRITDDREIQRLKDMARNLKEENEGLIARTASENASKEDLKRDFNFLLGTWKGVEEEATNVKAPHLLHSHAGMVRKVIRDRLLEDVDEVLTNSKPVYEDIIDYLHYLRMDNFQDVVGHYQKDTPLFKHYGVEEQLKKCLQREVSLDSGGYLAIDETEALTAIDVNTGGNVNHKNQAKAILNTNLSAAREIPIQLRLRKISGIIIVDFVDMYDNEDQQKVIDELKKSLREDRVPADFIDMTPLGLVEITRKREGESLADLMEGYHDEE